MPTLTAHNEDIVLDIESAARWHQDQIADGMLPFWVVSYNTPEFPSRYIARAWSAAAHGSGATVEAQHFNAVLVAPSLDAVRALLPNPRGLTRHPRERDDPFFIVERWMS